MPSSNSNSLVIKCVGLGTHSFLILSLSTLLCNWLRGGSLAGTQPWCAKPGARHLSWSQRWAFLEWPSVALFLHFGQQAEWGSGNWEEAGPNKLITFGIYQVHSSFAFHFSQPLLTYLHLLYIYIYIFYIYIYIMYIYIQYISLYNLHPGWNGALGSSISEWDLMRVGLPWWS